jgi:PIN domain nuclease of toxin-antitoxin system
VALLLDTNALLWIEYGDPRLGSQTKQAIRAAVTHGAAFVCPITFWEIGILAARGRFTLGVSLSVFRRIVLQGGYIERPIDGNDTVAMVALPNFHADPADCLLVATARNAGLTLVTSDRKILTWSGNVNRMDSRT